MRDYHLLAEWSIIMGWLDGGGVLGLDVQLLA